MAFYFYQTTNSNRSDGVPRMQRFECPFGIVHFNALFWFVLIRNHFEAFRIPFSLVSGRLNFRKFEIQKFCPKFKTCSKSLKLAQTNLIIFNY